MWKRILVVYNPNSSRYIDVRREVLDKLREVKGGLIGKFEVEKGDIEKNIGRFSEVIKNDDLVISAGGDATAAMVVNGILKSDKRVKLAVLPYGNFNDLSRTLGTKKVQDVFYNDKVVIKKMYPLEIFLNGDFFRYAACYVTIGMTAESVELFDDPIIRRKLKKGRKNSWRSYYYLMIWYFKNRHKKVFIPKFKLNGKDMKSNISDYFAVNGESISKVMRGGEDYLSPKVFKSATYDLVSFLKLVKMMILSMLIKIPAKKTVGDVLDFFYPSTVELQSEGEWRVCENLKKIEIKKSRKFLEVICIK